MAVRYRTTQQRPTAYRHSGRAWLIYLYSLPFLFAALSYLLAGNTGRFGLTLAIFLTMLLAARLIGQGIRNRREFMQRTFAVKKSPPLIALGSLVLAVAVFLAAWLVAGDGVLTAIGFSAAAAIGVWLWYGLDPVRPRGADNVEPEVQNILAASERRIEAIEKARDAIRQAELRQRLDRISRKARDVLALLAENPERIRQSRRFLSTYLEGTENIVRKYARTHKKITNQELESNFREVLTSIEDTFNRQYEKLLSSDVFDLDVDIEVLDTLMKKQGLG